MNSKSNAKLLPCPFCGTTPHIASDTTGTTIYCPSDQCIIGSATPIPFNASGHREAAIEAWNRRPSRLEAISEAEPVAWAWEGYWPGAGSEDSVTRVTRLESQMEKWKVDGAEITPLYPKSPPAGHVVVPVGADGYPIEMVDAGAAYLKRLGWSLEDFGRLPAQFNWHEFIATMLAALPHNQGGANG